MLNFPDSSLKDKMDYYVEPEEPEQDFIKIYGPEDITFIDAACGSGHILVYAFDLLYQMYLEEGYASEDIPEQILSNNLQGVEIDDRAAEIASFALEMKALEKDPDFLSKDIDAKIAVCHKCELSPEELTRVPALANETDLLGVMSHFDEIGSLYKPSDSDIENIERALKQAAESNESFSQIVSDKLADVLSACKTLKASYMCTAMNPPYISPGLMDPWVSEWVNSRYPEEKVDYCTCFIERGFTLAKASGYSALITMQGWMFLPRYKSMREKLLRNRTILSMAHLGAHAFDAIGGEVVATTATTFKNCYEDKAAPYFRLIDEPNEASKDRAFREALSGVSCKWRFQRKPQHFSAVPNLSISSYKASSETVELFKGTTCSDFLETREGMSTASNDRFLRIWEEVSFSKISLPSKPSGADEGKKWFPYQKGGSFRKWYGNNDYVVDWENNGYAIMHNYDEKTGRLRSHNFNGEYAFREGLTWSTISNELHVRYVPKGYLFDSTGAMGFTCDSSRLAYEIGMLNSTATPALLSCLGEALHFKFADIGNLPDNRNIDTDCVDLVRSSIELSKSDWDSFESSWDFQCHPLVPRFCERQGNGDSQFASVELKKSGSISRRFDRWKDECQERFDQLKSNEEELNRIFASIYHMEGEVPIEVPSDKVSVCLADKKRDVKSLVSYAVGCMFGRYSLDKPGLILADAGSTIDDYHAQVPNPTFEPDEDGILPVLEEPWLKDDIVKRFRDWLKASFGEESFEENLRFIEDALGMDIRTYFIKDGAKGFYANHCKTYSVTGSGKRPIYWMFSSPKHSFNALVYMHRYDRDTVAKILTDYVRPFRSALEAQAELLESSPSAAEQSRSMKYRAMVEELDGWEHDELFELARDHVEIDLDDGVKRNYAKFPVPGVLRKI